MIVSAVTLMMTCLVQAVMADSKVVLVTGVSKGIGKALALKLAGF
jgi:hypothetical protein